MITILGAAGFVGAALSRRLLSLNETVVNLSRPQFDLTQAASFRRIPPETDILIHAAGHVGSAVEDEILWRTNVESTYYLVEYLNTQCGARFVVYLSSGAVYGFQPEAIDHATPLHPDSLYGASKMLAERILETMLKTKVVILRLFFPFGPGQRIPRMIPGLTRRILKGEPIELNTSLGLPVINPIYIDDLIDQIIGVLRNPCRTHYNLGGARASSIKQIAEEIGRILQTTPNYLTMERKVDNLICKPDFLPGEHGTFEGQIAATVKGLLAEDAMR